MECFKYAFNILVVSDRIYPDFWGLGFSQNTPDIDSLWALCGPCVVPVCSSDLGVNTHSLSQPGGLRDALICTPCTCMYAYTRWDSA